MDEDRARFDVLADKLALAYPHWAPLTDADRAAIVAHVRTAPAITETQARTFARLFEGTGSVIQREQRAARERGGLRV